MGEDDPGDRLPAAGGLSDAAVAADERADRFSWLEFRDVELTLENATVEIRSSDPGATVWQIAGLTLSLRNLRRVEDGELVFELERGDWSALLQTGWKVPERYTAKGRDGY